MDKKTLGVTAEAAVKAAVLNNDCPALSDGDTTSMTLNQRMSLNETARINVNETRADKESGLDSGSYYVYVKGEGTDKKIPHFHIKSIGEGWDIRMLMDGTFHSVKTTGAGRKEPEDFRDIERIAKQWVKQANVLEPDRTNGEVAEIQWIRNNK